MDKHIYSAKLVRVVDGDTADAMIDLGFDTWVKKRIRFYGVDTWESRTRDLDEKAMGMAAKEYVMERCPVGGKVRLRSHDRGKFGRILGEIVMGDTTLNKMLVEDGHATEYFGGKR